MAEFFARRRPGRPGLAVFPRQTALVDRRAGVLGVLFGSLHTVPNGRRENPGYARATLLSAPPSPTV